MRKRVVVRGRVQGVFFRDSCRREAVAAGVSGFVRNSMDGSVEAELEGEPDAVERVVRWCHTGPRHARVDAVEVTDVATTGLAGFRVG